MRGRGRQLKAKPCRCSGRACEGPIGAPKLSSSDNAGVKVEAVESSTASGGASVRLADGNTITARRGVVVATEGPAAAQLLGSSLEATPSKSEAAVGTCCLYFRCVVPASTPTEAGLDIKNEAEVKSEGGGAWHRIDGSSCQMLYCTLGDPAQAG